LPANTIDPAIKMRRINRPLRGQVRSHGFESLLIRSAPVGARLAREADIRIRLTLRVVNFAGKPRSNGLRPESKGSQRRSDRLTHRLRRAGAAQVRGNRAVGDDQFNGRENAVVGRAVLLIAVAQKIQHQRG